MHNIALPTITHTGVRLVIIASCGQLGFFLVAFLLMTLLPLPPYVRLCSYSSLLLGCCPCLHMSDSAVTPVFCSAAALASICPTLQLLQSSVRLLPLPPYVRLCSYSSLLFGCCTCLYMSDSAVTPVFCSAAALASICPTLQLVQSSVRLLPLPPYVRLCSYSSLLFGSLFHSLTRSVHLLPVPFINSSSSRLTAQVGVGCWSYSLFHSLTRPAADSPPRPVSAAGVTPCSIH